VLARCLDEEPQTISVNASDRKVAELLAAYDVIAIAVLDQQGRLVGAVTVDDVIDRLLPVGWRVSDAEDNG
jgi:Mg/Co/Ni transporter MgtE